jgi:hypothetical protein
MDRKTGKHKIIIKGGVFARYVAPGFIVYARRSTLVAVPFDLKRLEVTGPPVTVQENVEGLKANGRVQFSISDGGDLAYVEGRADDPRDAAQSLVWVDRRGSEQVLSETRQRYSKPRLSADGHTLFVEVADPEAAIWSYNIDRGHPASLSAGTIQRRRCEILTRWSLDGICFRRVRSYRGLPAGISTSWAANSDFSRGRHSSCLVA